MNFDCVVTNHMQAKQKTRRNQSMLRQSNILELEPFGEYD